MSTGLINVSWKSKKICVRNVCEMVGWLTDCISKSDGKVLLPTRARPILARIVDNRKEEIHYTVKENQQNLLVSRYMTGAPGVSDNSSIRTSTMSQSYGKFAYGINNISKGVTIKVHSLSLSFSLSLSLSFSLSLFLFRFINLLSVVLPIYIYI